METFGNFFLTKLQGSSYDKVENLLQERYLQESSLDEIDEILQAMKKEAKQAHYHNDGLLRTVQVHDEIDTHMHWKVLLEKDGKVYPANHFPLSDLFGYPMEEESDDLGWLVDVIWNLTLGNDDDEPELVHYQQEDELESDLKMGEGNSEEADHVYNDDNEDEGRMNWHEPEKNL